MPECTHCQSKFTDKDFTYVKTTDHTLWYSTYSPWGDKPSPPVIKELKTRGRVVYVLCKACQEIVSMWINGSYQGYTVRIQHEASIGGPLCKYDYSDYSNRYGSYVAYSKARTRIIIPDYYIHGYSQFICPKSPTARFGEDMADTFMSHFDWLSYKFEKTLL